MSEAGDISEPTPEGRSPSDRGPDVRAPMTGVVTIYTDGACKGNPGPGGWGALLVWGDHEKELCGGEPATTNNRMELTAVIRALESLKRDCAVEIYTDSQYVKNGIESWIHGWKKNGWKTADRKPVKNAELWRELDALAAQHRVRVALGQGPQRPSRQRSRRCARQSRRRIDGPGDVKSDTAGTARPMGPARPDHFSSRRANTRISFSACLSPARGGDGDAVAIGGLRFRRRGPTRPAPCRRASTPP